MRCGKGVRRSDTLRLHQRTHTGEKPHTVNAWNVERAFVAVGPLDYISGLTLGRSHINPWNVERAFVSMVPFNIYIRFMTDINIISVFTFFYCILSYLEVF